jgi:5-methylcytosine-specific restriction endonuclease McrA
MKESNLTKKMVDLNVCHYCSAPLDDFSRTIDHLKPKSRGGILSNSNKVPSCKPCNQLKGNMTVAEFKRSIESLIHYETTNYQKRISHLKRMRFNIQKIMNNQKQNKT